MMPQFIDFSLSGWRAITLENDLLRVTLLPEKGSDIVEFTYKPAGIDYLWKSPIGLLPKPDADRLPNEQFMEWYEGGWQEILPSGGFPNTYAGVEYGLHGESWSLPCTCDLAVFRDLNEAKRNGNPEKNHAPYASGHAFRPEASEVSVVLTCDLTMLPLSIEKRLVLREGEAILRINETVTNRSDQPVDFMWGHHPALGAPFLNGDCVLDVPARDCEVGSVEGDPAARLVRGTTRKWPIATAKDGNPLDLRPVPPLSAKCSDEFWLTGLSEGWYAVTDTKRKLGFGMVWDLNAYRSLWVWQEFGGCKDEPFNGESYVMAVEPWSSYALEGLSVAVERGTHLTLPPRGSMSAWLKAVAYEGVERVAGISADGVIQP